MIQTWQFILAFLAGRINEHQRQVIEYLQEENRVLKEQLDKEMAGRRLLLDDDQRRRLAVQAKQLGRKTLCDMNTLFTPDTLLRWFRELVAQKYDGSANRKPGRPRKEEEIRAWILRLARENLAWGYTRIRGALCNLGFEVSRSTIRRILTENGIVPAPERRKHISWHDILEAPCAYDLCHRLFYCRDLDAHRPDPCPRSLRHRPGHSYS